MWCFLMCINRSSLPTRLLNLLSVLNIPSQWHERHYISWHFERPRTQRPWTLPEPLQQMNLFVWTTLLIVRQEFTLNSEGFCWSCRAAAGSPVEPAVSVTGRGGAERRARGREEERRGQCGGMISRAPPGWVSFGSGQETEPQPSNGAFNSHGATCWTTVGSAFIWND